MSPDGSFAISPKPRIVIYTLGRFEVVLDGVPLRFKGRAPVRALELLSALIAAGGRGVSVGSISDSLWPEADGFDAYGPSPPRCTGCDACWAARTPCAYAPDD